MNGQTTNNQDLEKGTSIQRNTLFNLDEIKVRWKKAALENCPGVPCFTATIPGAPTSVVATAGNASASVAFTAPASNGGSAITGYTVTSSPGSITATGATSPINVTGLTNGTAYTFTVIATNAVGNSLASSTSTAVTPVAPITAPGAPTSVVATAGNASASVAFTAPASNGGSAITGYTITSSPGSITATGATSPINVTGLTNGTAYTFAVIATNAVGNSVASAASTAVTPAVPFVCGTSTINDFDGNPYYTVLIGTQCWTKENLKVTKYNDGTVIPDLTASTSNPWANSGARTEYVAAGVTGYVGTFGYLYNWYAVNDPSKLCPAGWHVPTDSDWNKLVKYLDSGADTSSTSSNQSASAGSMMKEMGTTLWNSPNTGANNSSGFSAGPGGYRTDIGSFNGIRDFAIFWSATEDSTGRAWIRRLNNGDGDVSRIDIFESFGASIRCLRD
ncbi:MAG: fibronectin type III domain-containing protein [Saprospiraceae bacterium]|nr:fibronectin type III domain-containing protein [Saprospiraceae bacterium]